MSSYNLIFEPWLPVLDAGVDLRATPHAPTTLREVGLREILTRAHEIREVYTDSPLETIALNRLLLALVIDAFVPSPDEDQWRSVWKHGRFDADTVSRYFSDPVRADRFDLLHPEYPFYQHPQPLAKEPSPISKLFHAQASGNNATLFGHELDNFPVPASLAKTTRGVVCAQAFSLAGLAGASRKGGRLSNFTHAPLIGGAVFWIRGQSLFEALLLNAPPDAQARMVLDEDDIGQPPVWDRPVTQPTERHIDGYRDYLTLQARQLTLVTEENESGETIATGVYMAQGDKDMLGIERDPLMAQVVPRNKKKAAFPFGFRADRALWRDASTFFRLFRPAVGGGPGTFYWLKRLAKTEDVDRYAMDVYGLVNDKAKVELWRHERMPVFPVLLAEHSVEGNPLHEVTRALDFVEEQRSILNGAVRTIADYLLAPPVSGKDEKPKADTKAVTNLASSLDAESRFWASLEPRFFSLLQDLATDFDDFVARQQNLWDWAEQIYRAAKNALDMSTAHLDQDARQLRAVAEGYRRLGRIKEYRDYRKQSGDD